MKFILFVIIKISTQAVSISSTEFDTKEACLKASVKLNEAIHELKVSDDQAKFNCLPKLAW